MKTRLILLAALAIPLVGCTSVIMTKPDGTKISAATPAWFWQDGNQVIKKASITVKGTNSIMSLAGTTQTETANTNVLNFFKGVVDDAITAAATMK